MKPWSMSWEEENYCICYCAIENSRAVMTQGIDQPPATIVTMKPKSAQTRALPWGERKE
jgi:hypothetical protein